MNLNSKKKNWIQIWFKKKNYQFKQFAVNENVDVCCIASASANSVANVWYCVCVCVKCVISIDISSKIKGNGYYRIQKSASGAVTWLMLKKIYEKMKNY